MTPVSKGYAEGSAVEERFADLERAQRERRVPAAPVRLAVFGSTGDEPTPHFLGWADEVDADELFASGAAYGIKLRRVAASPRVAERRRVRVLTAFGAGVTMRQRAA